MTKLLDRPLKAFTIYSLVILLISIPVYVFVVDQIWVSELDENNWLTLEHTKKRLTSRAFTADDLEKINQIWGELQPGVSITKMDEPKLLQDSVYEVVRPNEYDSDDGEDRFRGLKSHLLINGESYQITIETNVEEADETLLAVAVVTFFFFVILIIGFILLNRRIAADSWRPFYQILSSLQSFDLTKDSVLHLPKTDIQEFQQLTQSLEQLVNKNISTYQQQKSFIENASHELQTPIALLKSKLDLLIQKKGLTPEIAQILSSIEAPLSRLTRINKNLLLLAKVENHQYTDQASLSVNQLIGSSLVLFEDYIYDKNLSVEHASEATLSVISNSFLLETLIHNLLSNAIRHTSVKGKVIIRLEGKTLIIANSGTHPLDEKQLFERFSALSNEKVSSGLGLAIIKEISKKYNWQVGCRFENGYHTLSVIF